MVIVGAMLTFLLSFLLLRHIYSGGILFYQGVALAFFISMLQFGLARFRFRIPWLTSFKDAALSFLLAYAFVFTFPTTVDRSYTVLMLEHIADNPDGLSREDVSRFFARDFVEHGGVDKRLLEQQATGAVVERDGRYTLTAGGRTLVAAFEATCWLFACQHRLQ